MRSLPPLRSKALKGLGLLSDSVKNNYSTFRYDEDCDNLTLQLMNCTVHIRCVEKSHLSILHTTSAKVSITQEQNGLLIQQTKNPFWTPSVIEVQCPYHLLLNLHITGKNVHILCYPDCLLGKLEVQADQLIIDCLEQTTLQGLRANSKLLELTTDNMIFKEECIMKAQEGRCTMRLTFVPLLDLHFEKFGMLCTENLTCKNATLVTKQGTISLLLPKSEQEYTLEDRLGSTLITDDHENTMRLQNSKGAISVDYKKEN